MVLQRAVQDETVQLEARVEPDPASQASRARRLGSLDALRGLAIAVMLLVMNPGPTDDLPGQLHHAEWHGLTVADLAFPLFLFAVGTSLTMSSRGLDRRHALKRAATLVVLGIALGSLKNEAFRLTGVLQHIAGAYLLAVLILRAPRRYWAPTLIGILVTTWLAFTTWAGPTGDPWGDGGTLAHAVDGWLIGGFTAEGVLQTIISTATVLGGALAGQLIKDTPSRSVIVRKLAGYGVGVVTAGLLFSLAVPINKRLWTPSYATITLGVSLAILAAGVWLIDLRQARRAAAPLVHMGANPTLVYILSMTALFSIQNFDLMLVSELPLAGSPELGAVLLAAGWIALWWLFSVVLYRRQIFVKI